MKRTHSLTLGLACLALAGLASVGFAGTYPQDHNGWSLGLGVGGGSAGVSVDGFGSSDRTSGAMGSFHVGYPLNPQVSLGVQGSGWSKSENGATVTFSATTVGASFYPSEGFLIRGGIGLGSTTVAVSSGNATLSSTESGLGLSYGIGYEFRLTRTFALGPQIEGGYAKFDGGSSNWAGLELGLSWYLLPKQ